MIRINTFLLIIVFSTILFSCSHYEYPNRIRICDSVVRGEYTIISVDGKVPDYDRFIQGFFDPATYVPTPPCVAVTEGEHHLTLRYWDRKQKINTGKLEELTIHVNKNHHEKTFYMVDGKPSLISLPHFGLTCKHLDNRIEIIDSFDKGDYTILSVDGKPPERFHFGDPFFLGYQRVLVSEGEHRITLTYRDRTINADKNETQELTIRVEKGNLYALVKANDKPGLITVGFLMDDPSPYRHDHDSIKIHNCTSEGNLIEIRDHHNGGEYKIMSIDGKQQTNEILYFYVTAGEHRLTVKKMNDSETEDMTIHVDYGCCYKLVQTNGKPSLKFDDPKYPKAKSVHDILGM